MSLTLQQMLTQTEAIDRPEGFSPLPLPLTAQRLRLINDCLTLSPGLPHKLRHRRYLQSLTTQQLQERIKTLEL